MSKVHDIDPNMSKFALGKLALGKLALDKIGLATLGLATLGLATLGLASLGLAKLGHKCSIPNPDTKYLLKSSIEIRDETFRKT